MSDDNFQVSYNEMSEWWLSYTDEQGRKIYRSNALGRLMADSFSDDPPPGWIELDKIYKWPDLEQTGYEISFEPKDVSIIGGGILRLKNAVRIKDIKIKFQKNNKDQKSLRSYLSDKDLYLDILTSFALHQASKRQAHPENKYNILGSTNLSKILSVQGTWDSQGNITGNPNIFESDELLDQLTLTMLILHARWGHNKSLQILLALLNKTVENFIINLYGISNEGSKLFYMWDEQRREDILNTVFSFVTDVFRNSDSLEPRFKFNINSKQSLLHFLAGKIVKENKQHNQWIPKIQEFLRDSNKKTRPEAVSRLTIPYEGQTAEEAADVLFQNQAKHQYESEAEKFNQNIVLEKIREYITKAKWPQKQQKIFESLFYSDEDKTQREVATIFGVTEAYISKVVKKRSLELREKFNSSS